MKSEMVVCNGCTACCQNDLIFLKPGDRPEDYPGATVPSTNPLTGEEGLALKHKPGGGCWYVGPTGCTIHGRAPLVCRTFDCRKLMRDFLSIPRPERRRLQRRTKKVKLFSQEMMDAALARMDTLPDR